MLDEAPLIVAEGADVVRRVRIELAAGAVAALRDVVVLGRDGEGRGALDSAPRVTLGGRAAAARRAAHRRRGRTTTSRSAPATA